jgi:phage FluMu protein Com
MPTTPGAVTPRRAEVRCTVCTKRLLDYENTIEAGVAVVKKRCDRCGALNTIRLEASGA